MKPVKKTLLILFYLAAIGCVDTITFDVPPVNFQLVVDGFITDEPGPYTIRLTRASSLDKDHDNRVPVFGAKVTISSDAGESELLIEPERGRYVTNRLQGRVGKSYTLRIQTSDGKTYQSSPEKMAPAGEIQNLSYAFESQTVVRNGIEFPADYFAVFVDSKGASQDENYIRWRAIGTYQIETMPQLRTKQNPNGGGQSPDPVPCSGYFVGLNGLQRISDCFCCNCWITAYAEVPVVTDGALSAGGQFNKIEVAAVPINRRTFYDKFHVEVQQMGITKNAFTYWKLIRAQKEGAASLFQPPLAKL